MLFRSKVREQRRELEFELSKLNRFQGSRSRGGLRGAVAPKYRNPENPTETWAGRGLQPRWLAAAIKSGKKLEDFWPIGHAIASYLSPVATVRIPNRYDTSPIPRLFYGYAVICHRLRDPAWRSSVHEMPPPPH